MITLRPRWYESAGAILRTKVKVRSRCCKCETLLRVDLQDVVARHGERHCLVDRLDRCRMVGCEGSVSYLATQTYGGEWTSLVRDPWLAEKMGVSAQA